MPLTRRDFLRIATLSGVAIPWFHQLGLAYEAPAVGESENLSPFLRGNFAPVHEEVTLNELSVVGEIPKALNGMFVRNGPNPQFTPIGRYHWFDGDGMLHGVRLENGRASYRNRYVQTTGFREELAAGKPLWTGLAMPPDFSKLLAGKSLFKNAANTALVWHDKKLLALWEGGEPYQIDVPELSTVGAYDYRGKLRHPFTAHPKVDVETGEMMLFGYSPLTPFVQYSTVNAAGELTRTVPIKLRRPVMMHDFAVTERYSVFMDLPVVLGMEQAGGSASMMHFDPELGSRFGVLPRHGSQNDIKWFDSPSCYVFHTLNAYEDNDEVVLIACRISEFHDIADAASSADDNSLPVTGAPTLYEWRFNMATGATREKVLDDAPTDFPRLNDRRLGRPMRFGYAMDLKGGELLKYDFKTGLNLRHSFGRGRYGGEGVFVEHPDAKSEEQGWLITYVFDQSSGTSELVIVDAEDFTANAVARVRLPVRVPFGFHGIWLNESQLS